MALLISFLLLTGCGGPPPQNPEEVWEAVISYQFSQWPAQIYCVSLGEWGHDPTDAFLVRFADLKDRKVQKASDCTSNPANLAALDKATGAPATRVLAGSVRWTGAREAELDGGYSVAGEGGGGGSYRLSWKDGHWYVSSYRETWIAHDQQEGAA